MNTFPIAAQMVVIEQTASTFPRKNPPTCFIEEAKPPPSERMYTARNDDAEVPQQVPQPSPTEIAAVSASANI